MDLVASMLKSPTFPADEFEQLRTQSITGIESSMTEPQAIAGNAMGRHFNPWPKGHPYYNDTFEESIAALRALELDQVQGFHREFYGAGFGEIAVVGDFDVAAFKGPSRTTVRWLDNAASLRAPARPGGRGRHRRPNLPDPRQGQRGDHAAHRCPAVGHQSRLRGADRRQLRAGRRHAQIAPGRPRAPEGRLELFGGLALRRRRAYSMQSATATANAAPQE